MSHCKSCGYTLNEFLNSGRFLCTQCYFAFWYKNFSNRTLFTNHYQVNRFIEYLSHFNLSKSILNDIRTIEKQISSISYPQLLELCANNNQVQIRFRLARNFKNCPFLINQSCLDNINSQIIQFIKNSFGISIYPFPNNKIPIAGYNLYFFDEDHIRIEKWIDKYWTEYQSNILRVFSNPDIFSHTSKIGYINSCPTNSIRGNKLSIEIDLKNLFLIQNGLLVQKLITFVDSFRIVSKKIYLSNIDSKKIILHTKNFNQTRLSEFLRFILLLLKLSNLYSEER